MMWLPIVTVDGLDGSGATTLYVRSQGMYSGVSAGHVASPLFRRSHGLSLPVETRLRHVLRTAALVGDVGDDVIVSRATLAHALQSPSLGAPRLLSIESPGASWCTVSVSPSRLELSAVC